ncbi:MAG: Fic family protein [Phycisphaerales bacterium]
MAWNWQLPDWPSFDYDSSRLGRAEGAFLREAGVVIGSIRHLPEAERGLLTVELLGREAVTTSEIEGELLDRDSVQSSIRRQLGLAADNRRVRPAEQGVAEVMVDLYRSFAEPLTHETLFGWHRLLMKGRNDLSEVGGYRTHTEPMQIVSGRIDNPRVHFEAPPSIRVSEEMDRFLDWFARTGPGGERALPAVTRAGLAHLYFESIHPFEDGNGRVGRAISEKALAQGVGEPSLTALAATILRKRAAYYSELELANKSNTVTRWLEWFAATVVEAQRRTQAEVEFTIAKTRMLDRLRGKINERQEKALLRMFREGIDGFKGGMSAEKYRSITGATPATTTRDLAALVELEALARTGERKGTRYHLAVGTAPVRPENLDRL